MNSIDRIPAPHVVAARAYRLAARKRAAASSESSTPLSREPTLHEVPLAEASGSGSSTTFTRLAKLLHQSTALAGRSSLQPPPAGDNVVHSLGLGLGLGLGEEAPRRLSWERCVCVIYNIPWHSKYTDKKGIFFFIFMQSLSERMASEHNTLMSIILLPIYLKNNY